MQKQRLSRKQWDLIHDAVLYYETVVEDECNSGRFEFDENYESDPAYIEMNRRLSELSEIIAIVSRKINKGENK